jgi:hypothetical protein
VTATEKLRLAMDVGDLQSFRALLEHDPTLASQPIDWGRPCRIGPGAPLSCLPQMRFNGLGSHPHRAEMARCLLAAGASVNGEPGARETPLITAASYDDIHVAAVLIEGGADLEATGYAIPNGTALAHAVQFGAPEIADRLVAAGARVASLVEAAGTGNLGGRLGETICPDEAARALRAAALCSRRQTIAELLAWGVPVSVFAMGGTALHWAAWEAKAEAARYLVEHGANPQIRDPEHYGTPLDWARHRAKEPFRPHAHGHEEVIEFLDNL